MHFSGIDTITQLYYYNTRKAGRKTKARRQKGRENMEDNERMATCETRALIQAIRILNEEIKDPDRLDQRLQEIQEALEKGVTEAAGQAKR